MKCAIFLYISRHSAGVWNFSVGRPEEADWMKGSDSYKFVTEIEFDIADHVDWLTNKGADLTKEMEEEARGNLKKIVDFKAKLRQLTCDDKGEQSC